MPAPPSFAGLRSVEAEASIIVLLHDSSIQQLNGSLCVLRKAGVVRNHADSSAILVKLAQQIHDGICIGGIKVSGRLISKKNGR